VSGEILPDTRGHTGAKRHWFLGNTVPTFCANCQAQGPYVAEENCTFAFWLCNNCFEKWGPIAATMILPDEALAIDKGDA